MSSSVWTPMTKVERREAWRQFDDKVDFRPSVHKRDWPGIDEPEPSATWSIGAIYGDAERYARMGHDLATKALAAFQECAQHGERMIVLDWQHECYWLDPHGGFAWDDPDEWPVPALPNGDYYIFLQRRMRWGWFGHPWEQTICVWGDLLTAVEDDLPDLFESPVRRRPA